MTYFMKKNIIITINAFIQIKYLVIYYHDDYVFVNAVIVLPYCLCICPFNIAIALVSWLSHDLGVAVVNRTFCIILFYLLLQRIEQF